MYTSGEFCGPGVNGNQLGLKEYKFFVFTVQDSDKKQYLPLSEQLEVCRVLGLDHVPILLQA